MQQKLLYHALDLDSEVIFKVGFANLASRNFMGSCDFTDSSRCVAVGVVGLCPPFVWDSESKRGNKREEGEYDKKIGHTDSFTLNCSPPFLLSFIYSFHNVPPYLSHD